MLYDEPGGNKETKYHPCRLPATSGRLLHTLYTYRLKADGQGQKVTANYVREVLTTAMLVHSMVG